MSETRDVVTPAISELNRLSHTMAWRCNAGRVKVRGGWMQLHSPGTADILAFPQGRVVWLETKDPLGHTNQEQKESQENFRYKVTELGHEYYRVTSIDEALEVLR